jgi:hypothetical protein
LAEAGLAHRQHGQLDAREIRLATSLAVKMPSSRPIGAGRIVLPARAWPTFIPIRSLLPNRKAHLFGVRNAEAGRLRMTDSPRLLENPRPPARIFTDEYFAKFFTWKLRNGLHRASGEIPPTRAPVFS